MVKDISAMINLNILGIASTEEVEFCELHSFGVKSLILSLCGVRVKSLILGILSFGVESLILSLYVTILCQNLKQTERLL